MVIEKAVLIIRTIELIGDSDLGHTTIFENGISAIIPHNRVQVRNLTIYQNNASYNCEKVFTENLAKLVVVGLVSDVDVSGYFNKNPLNFQAYGVTCMELN